MDSSTIRLSSGPAAGESADVRVVVVSADEAQRPWAGPILASAGMPCEVLADAAPLLARAPIDQPGCVVLDVHLPDASGLDVQSALAQRQDRRAVLFLASSGDVPTAVQAMRAGASDFLLKPLPPSVFIEAVRRALSDSLARSRELALRSQMLRRYDTLTARERQVMGAVAAGYLNKQIAWRLQTAERTVKAQRAKAMEKIGARTTADLVRFAHELARAGLAPERI